MIKALLNNVIVEPEFEANVSESGIYLKERKLQATPNVGTVVSIGKDVKNVAVGDRIVFHTKKNNPEGFKLNGESYIHIEGDEVYAKL